MHKLKDIERLVRQHSQTLSQALHPQIAGQIREKPACTILPSFALIALEKRTTMMSLVLDLPSELEAELATEAAQFGLPLPNDVVGLLATGHC